MTTNMSMNLETILNEMLNHNDTCLQPDKYQKDFSISQLILALCVLILISMSQLNLWLSSIYIPIILSIIFCFPLKDSDEGSGLKRIKSQSVKLVLVIILLTVLTYSHMASNQSSAYLLNTSSATQIFIIAAYISSRQLTESKYWSASALCIIILLSLPVKDKSNFYMNSLLICYILSSIRFLEQENAHLKEKEHNLKDLYEMFSSVFNNINSGLAIIHDGKLKIFNSYFKMFLNHKQSSDFSFKEQNQSSSIGSNLSDAHDLEYLDDIFVKQEELPHMLNETILNKKSSIITNSESIRFRKLESTNSGGGAKAESDSLSSRIRNDKAADSTINQSSNTDDLNIRHDASIPSKKGFNSQNEIMYLGQYHLRNGSSNRKFEIYKKNEKCCSNISQLFIHEVSSIVADEKQKAEKKFKNIFLAKMAHEIKTPCIAINCLMAANTRNEDPEELIRRIKIFSLSDMILNIISETNLYISGLDNISLNFTEMYLEDLLKWSQAILMAILECDNSKINIKPNVKISKRYNTVKQKHLIYSDERKMKIIISQILKNAIKFTTQGEISIILTESFTDKRICITIEDSGIGMPESKIKEILSGTDNIEDMNHLFVKYGGLGIGLKIVKALCSKLDIEFLIESKENYGTKISLHIGVTNTTSYLSTNNFYKQDLDIISNGSLSKNTIPLKYLPPFLVESDSNTSAIDSACEVVRKASDSNLDPKFVNDENLNGNTINSCSKRNYRLKNSFNCDDLQNLLLEKRDFEKENKKVLENPLFQCENNFKRNIDILEGINKKKTTRFKYINDSVKYQIKKKSKSFKFDSNISPIEFPKVNITDTLQWQSVKSESESNVLKSNLTKRKDTVFLDMKNISGELGIANTKLSNNSIYPFKSGMSKLSLLSKSKKIY